MTIQYNTARYVAAPLTAEAVTAYYQGGCGGNCLVNKQTPAQIEAATIASARAPAEIQPEAAVPQETVIVESARAPTTEVPSTAPQNNNNILLAGALVLGVILLW